VGGQHGPTNAPAVTAKGSTWPFICESHVGRGFQSFQHFDDTARFPKARPYRHDHGDDCLRPYFDLRIPCSRPRLAGTWAYSSFWKHTRNDSGGYGFGLIPAAFTSCEFIEISACRNLSHSVGVMAIGSPPSASSLSCTLLVAIAFFVS
jgi:hypothetical protein